MNTKVIFESELTPVNAMEQIEKFVSLVNKLAKKEILVLSGTIIRFIDGGLINELQSRTSKKFSTIDLQIFLGEEFESISFFVLNVARYGLLSHDLFDQIRIGPGGKDKNALMIGIPE